MTALVLIFVAMAVKDVFQAAYVDLLKDHRPWLAGGMDGTSDVLSFGFVGISIFDHPHRTVLWTLAAFVCLWTGSVLGTWIGNRVEVALQRRKETK